MDANPQNEWKKAAAEAAARLVQRDMVVGLGSGSTAAYFVRALGQRMASEGLRIVGIPTSEKTATLARSLQIPLTNFAEHLSIDLTVDGADEIELGTLSLIKGHGGALLREKIVASASRRMVVVGDETKIVVRLGSRESVPVEVVPFGREVTQRELQKMDARTQLRTRPDTQPFITDGGNCIVDCTFPPIEN
ncbi:MAG: ribose 5-phosphate isomerase A, partial [Candidatus Binataceae bacterium]